MQRSSFLEEILFVIVLYKTRLAESQAYGSIQKVRNSSPGISLFIYDNSPQAASPSDQVIYRHDALNSGVSKAYNEAFQIAERLNKKWMMLLDQDTEVSDSFIEKFFEAVQTSAGSVAFVPMLKDKKGIVSPFRWSLGKGDRITDPPEKLQLKDYRFVNSGLLISCSAFSNVGGYEEKIPLDFSDIAFGEKLMRKTDHFVVVQTVFNHHFSGSVRLSKQEAADRFHFFCAGAFAMGRIFGRFPVYYLRVLLRALLLSIKFRKVIFFKTFYQHTING